jgi:urease accessory protein
VIAHGTIVVAADADTGRAHLQRAEGDPPFSIRRCGERVLIAASAAAPVGGDELSLDIGVLDGAVADIGTVASTIVLPGPTGASSSMTTRCEVGADAHLDWIGEPTVSVVGSDHEVVTSVDLAASSTCRIVEEVSLGRTGEPSGRLRLVLRVVRDAATVVHHDESFGPDVPGAGSVVSVGTARHVLSAVLVGVDAGPSRSSISDDCRVAWLPVSPDVAVVLAVGTDRPSVRAAVERVAPEVIAPR